MKRPSDFTNNPLILIGKRVLKNNNYEKIN